MQPLSQAARDVLPLVLASRILLTLALLLAQSALFPAAPTFLNHLRQAPTLTAARQAVAWPAFVEQASALFGWLALDSLLMLATAHLLWTMGHYLTAWAAQPLALVRYSSWTALAFVLTRALDNFHTGLLATAIQDAWWPTWARYVALFAHQTQLLLIVATLTLLVLAWWRHRSTGHSLLLAGKAREVARLVYFLRIPLLNTFALTLLAPLALGPLAAFLGVALWYSPDLAGLWQLFLTCLLANMAGFAAMAQVGILLVRGPERFDSETYTPDARWQLRLIFQRSAFLAANLLCAASVFASLSLNPSHFLWAALTPLAWLAGIVGALAIAMAADWLRALVSASPGESGELLSYLILPGQAFRNGWQAILQHQQQRPGGLFRRILSAFVHALGYFPRRFSWKGFVDSRTNELYPELSGALATLLLATTVFAALVYITQGRGIGVNAMASLVLLLLVLGWLLTGVSHFADRYRIPVLAAALALWLIAASLGPTGYHFPITAAARPPGLTASAMLRLRQRPVLVAASGGGIQAGAWMTAALAQLKQADPTLSQRIALISAVSGGSAGAYFLGSTWDADWSLAASLSRQSSLGRIAWALVGLDFFRPAVVALGHSQWDRGYTLEVDFQRRTGKSESLSDWAARAGANFPVFLLNTTVVETGGPVAFATGAYPSDAYRQLAEWKLANQQISESQRSFFARACPALPAVDLNVATAARLSATFPYVSPAARPNVDPALCNFHFVDGGYYDNYGLISLLEWLDDGLSGLSPTEISALGPIEILVIRGRLPAAPSSSGNPWTTTQQATAPLSTFLNMRGYAQWHGGGALLRLMEQKWQPRGVQLHVRPLIYQGPDALPDPRCGIEPLTWKLTPQQENCILTQAANLTKTIP